MGIGTTMVSPCECHSSLHPASGCGIPAVIRWVFPADTVYDGEPGYIDLCGDCQAEWWAHGLESVTDSDDDDGGRLIGEAAELDSDLAEWQQ